MFLLFLILYVLCGVTFSLIFLSRFITALHEASSETRWTFMLIILPACVVLWPVLLAKYVTNRNEMNDDQTA
ncbi:hypothetical protein [Chryseolinea lacunae]|uniref:Cardiolipin synthase N-terminal domain-containing protein n=1 Tax=Chryseolinea lacunae TaxID=2801331 RepID=A0ABS1KZ46_9BACT|nr:hypothetical protein [Chryseolinea lacunae]MBL0744507.1 hypothetical protein [Chryseolinea lacunae]